MSGVAPPTVLQPGGCVTAAHMLAPPTSLWPFTSPREALQPKGWGCSHSHEGPERSRFVPPTRGLWLWFLCPADEVRAAAQRCPDLPFVVGQWALSRRDVGSDRLRVGV